MESRPAQRRRGGFTLLELLAVVAIVGVVTGLLLPVLAGARARSRMVQCVAHLHEFSLAVANYSGDQADMLPANRPGVSLLPNQTWVRGWLWGASPDATNRLYLNQSMLGSYLTASSLWRCPGDMSTVRLGVRSYPRVRSLSMNQFVGAPQPLRDRATYRRFSDFNNSAPGDVWVLTDESPDTLDDGTFSVSEDFNLAKPSTWRIADLPGVFHPRATGMTFADGHAGMVLWSDRRTLTAYFGYQAMPGNQDLAWLEAHSSAPAR